MSSSRLAGKALKEINGKPIIRLLIERVKRSKEPMRVVICTTTNQEDTIFQDIAKKLGILCFGGDEVDILERYRQAARKFDIQNIINVDGDDIFCEPTIIDKTARILSSDSETDCIVWRDLPLGATPIGITTTALERACAMKATENTETGWARYFTETGLFNVRYVSSHDSSLGSPDIRLTLDYPEDLVLAEAIYSRLNEPFDLRRIVDLLKKNPELLKINEGVKETYFQNFAAKSGELKLKQ